MYFIRYRILYISFRYFCQVFVSWAYYNTLVDNHNNRDLRGLKVMQYLLWQVILKSHWEFDWKTRKNNIPTLNISLLDSGTLPRSESNDYDEIIASTYRQLKDIIALYETNTITKYNCQRDERLLRRWWGNYFTLLK